MLNARQVALRILKDIALKESYTDIALNRGLQKVKLSPQDRALVTELVYGTVRRQRTLDALIDQLGKKKAHQQPLDIRLILHLGFYQLRYLDGIPVSAAVNTSVDLAKQEKYSQLAGAVNGILRQYVRLSEGGIDPLILPRETVASLGIIYSFPDWIIELFLKQYGVEETEKLCSWFNQTPTLDIRINTLKTSLEEVKKALEEAGIKTHTLPGIPQGLRLVGSHGALSQWPGYNEGWWTVQDASAQSVTHLLAPRPQETIIDACAAPGGKTTHIAELMGDQGKIWAIDPIASRLSRLQENSKRLGLTSIEVKEGDSRYLSEFNQTADRLLLDVPCSGLGTLHRNPDLRWKQTPQKMQDLIQLQKEILEFTQHWVKPKGILVYSTCTLNQGENEEIIENFLRNHPEWKLDPASNQLNQIVPHRDQRDGFFMVKLYKE